ncbi:MAG: NnrS family protein [Candidatus Omnitrophica bacterium]|nr:NnrS family protein [Candidatus Omnitrophota bacterium]
MNLSRYKTIQLFCSEPYRLFFPLGVLIGTVGAGHWLIYWRGWISSYSGFFHASIQMEGYMACFVLGFLTTAIPRFSNTPHASLAELLAFFLLTCGILFFLFQYLWVPAELCFIAWLLSLARFIFVRIKKRRQNAAASKISPPLEFIWIPIAIFHGLLGSIILILYQLKLAPIWMGDIGEDMAFQGFILSIVAGVGGFLAPRLMGRFEVIKPTEVCAMEEVARKKKRNLLVHLTLALLFFLSFWLDTPGHQIWANCLRALIITVVLIWTRALPLPPRTTDFFVKLLWISIWMVPLGLWMIAFFPAHEKGLLHFTFIGGFSLMTFAIATMVVLSHGGESAALRRPLPVLWMVLAGVIFTLGFRIAAGFYPNLFFPYLGIAASVWILTGISWLCFITPRIFRVAFEGSFEHTHEEMKRRVVNLNQ